METESVTVSHCLCASPLGSALCSCLCVHVYSAGNICMFRSNEALHVSVAQSPPQLNTTIGNIHTFLTAVPQVRGETLLWMEVHSTSLETHTKVKCVRPQRGCIRRCWLTYCSSTLSTNSVNNLVSVRLGTQSHEFPSSVRCVSTAFVRGANTHTPQCSNQSSD